MTSGSSGDDAWRPVAPPPVAAGAPEILDGYTDLVEVGRGGDSVVYRAQQTSMRREVAIKVLNVDDPARAARFEREIQITVGLGRQHPNIINVLAVGTTASGRPAIVMDFYEGGTLHDQLKTYGPLPADEVGRIGEVLADALSFAHDRGVLHRDVKPQNVLVLPTSWVLADFGIARLADSEHTSSAETFTYRHAAPQVLDGLPPSASDDLWSLGSTLYTLLDGRPPFSSDDPDDDAALVYLRRARVEPHRPLTVPGAERIAPIIDRCLAKDPAERWATAAELRDAFHDLRSTAWEPGVGSGATLPPAAPKVLRPDGGRRLDATPTPTPTPTPVDPVFARPPEAPPEPPPVALSVAAHATSTADAMPTGYGLPDTTGTDPRLRPPDVVPPGDDDVEKPGRQRLPILLVVGALVLGVAIFYVAQAIRSKDDQVPVSQATARPDTTVPTLADPPSGATPVERFDPDLSFQFTDMRPDGPNIHLEYTDPSDGEGEFYLYRLLPAPEGPVFGVAPGHLEWDEPASFPPGKSCYIMIMVLANGDAGRSYQRRCYPYPESTKTR